MTEPGHKLVSNFNFLINFNSSCLINFNGSSLKTLIKEKFEILLPRSFHSLITALRKGILKKLSNLKTQDFVAMRTSCIIDVTVWWSQEIYEGKKI